MSRAVPVRRLPAVLLAAALGLMPGACAGGSDPGGGGNSISDLLEAERQRRRSAPRAPRPDAGAAELPRGWKEDFDRAWGLFLRGDPAWPAARAAWTSRGAEARIILVENLIRAHVLARDQGDGSLFYRARDELAPEQDLAAPYLVEGLARGGGDTVVRNLLGELLASFGEVVLPAVEAGYAGASDWRGRQALLRALKVLRSSRSVPFLVRVAESDSDYRVRLEAIEGLGRIGDPRGRPALVRCLRDRDPSVRKFAAGHLGAMAPADPETLKALVDCYEKALDAADLEIARTARRSLSLLLGGDLGSDPRAWRAAVEREARR
jgi:hypothetical protein